MKKNISIKSWQRNFRERYPGLRRAVMHLFEEQEDE